MTDILFPNLFHCLFNYNKMAKHYKGNRLFLAYKYCIHDMNRIKSLVSMQKTACSIILLQAVFPYVTVFQYPAALVEVLLYPESYNLHRLLQKSDAPVHGELLFLHLTEL